MEMLRGILRWGFGSSGREARERNRAREYARRRNSPDNHAYPWDNEEIGYNPQAARRYLYGVVPEGMMALDDSGTEFQEVIEGRPASRYPERKELAGMRRGMRNFFQDISDDEWSSYWNEQAQILHQTSQYLREIEENRERRERTCDRFANWRTYTVIGPLISLAHTGYQTLSDILHISPLQAVNDFSGGLERLLYVIPASLGLGFALDYGSRAYVRRRERQECNEMLTEADKASRESTRSLLSTEDTQAERPMEEGQ